MDIYNIFYPSDQSSPNIPTRLFKKFPKITSTPEIHSGWPHIKGTRILVTDIFKAQLKSSSTDSIRSDYRSLGIVLTSEQIQEANKFSAAWLDYLLNGKTN